MNIIILIIPLSLLLGTFFVCAFIKAARSGQYDDLDTPAYRLLLEDNQLLINNSRKVEEENEG